ncbi:MAG: transketolase C-terminal domain-containing protein [Planctomycetota bacterium]
MRNAFRDAVYEWAKRDERVVLLSADIGNRMFDAYKADFPDRFYNVGVAEQNMIGLASGLAMSGLRPVCYTIANFTTYRVIEQIRVDLCYHHQPVIVAGVGGGLSYATLGSTHHSCEDLGMLRSLPSMDVLTPGDPTEVTACVELAKRKTDGPTYIRLGKKGEPHVHANAPRLEPATWIRMPGSTEAPEVDLLNCGTVLPVAIEAAERLREQGIEVALHSCVSVKPLDTDALEQAFTRCRLVVTLEEHSTQTGFGSAVAEWKADRELRSPLRAGLLRIGTPDAFLHRTGSQAYGREITGLTPGAVVRRITETLHSAPSAASDSAAAVRG